MNKKEEKTHTINFQREEKNGNMLTVRIGEHAFDIEKLYAESGYMEEVKGVPIQFLKEVLTFTDHL